MKYYTIPFFITDKGCPHKCVFCDQGRITGRSEAEDVDPRSISEKIELFLSTMKRKEAFVQVGFFGGSFTGLPPEIQEKYLLPVKEFISSGRVKGVRVSTRPDMISEMVMDLLIDGGVKCVELGVQSASNEVLERSGRGHTFEDSVRASKLIKSRGLALTHQFMLGLPGSTYEKEFFTARSAVELGADEVRIYPVIVIEGTELASMWRRNEYDPLSLDEAVLRASRLIRFFNKAGVKVIRCGIHYSETMAKNGDYLSGPFHQAFGGLARASAGL